MLSTNVLSLAASAITCGQWFEARPPTSRVRHCSLPCPISGRGDCSIHELSSSISLSRYLFSSRRMPGPCQQQKVGVVVDRYVGLYIPVEHSSPVNFVAIVVAAQHVGREG